MTQAGYAGNPRYNVAAAAVGVRAGGRRRRRARAGRPRAGASRSRRSRSLAALLAFTAGDLADQVDELASARTAGRSSTRSSTPAAPRVPRAPPARTNQPMKAMLAWRLDVAMEHLADPPRPPAAVFRAPPGYDGEPAEPPVAGRLRGGRARRATGRSPRPARLTPAAARSGP